MSYLREASEKFIVKNDTNDTKAFVKSLKKYVLDFLEGIRIESLSTFHLELTADDILIIGSHIDNAEDGGGILLESIQVGKAGIENLVKNLDNYVNINLFIDYSGSFYYFYPYGVARFHKLLNENLKGKVTYECEEDDDEEVKIYVFRELEGELIQGLVKPRDIKEYNYINDWEVKMLSFYSGLNQDIPWELFHKVENLVYSYCEKYNLSNDFKLMTALDDDDVYKKEMAEVGDIIIELPLNFGMNRNDKTVFEINKIMNMFDGINEIYELIRDFLECPRTEWLFTPLKASFGKLSMRLGVDGERNLFIGVYDIKSNYVTQYGKSDEKLLGLIESVGDIVIPFNMNFEE